MKLKCILVVMTVLIQANKAQAGLCDELYRMSNNQLNTLIQSYKYGKKYGLGYTLAAIAWQESQAGLYPVNISDPSFGVHHILLTTAMKRGKVRNTSFHRNMLASELLNHDVSASYAIKELKYWKRYHKGNWKRIWASYNAGHNFKNGLKYSQQIEEKIQKIKTCL